MNTEDFKPLKIPKKPLEHIFKKQKEILHEFMLLEGIDLKTYNFDINCLEDQQLLKDFLQIRFIEELTEASVDMDNRNHFEEEIIDAFNFLVEAYILYGYSYKDLKSWVDFDFEHSQNSNNNVHMLYSVVEKVGKTCNLLKNRPWKQSQYLVDLYLFEENLKKIWAFFNKLCSYFNISLDKLFEVWSLKYQVNKFRIRTRY